MEILDDPVDRLLLDNWQRDFPIIERPFAELAADLETDEQDVLRRLNWMLKSGQITRVGATCSPNTVSASTLAAMAVPPEQIDEVALIIGRELGVNHSYERENHWNLWFVVTGPDRTHVAGTLDRIRENTGLQVLDLQLVRPFNVDLGFRMSGEAAIKAAPATARIIDCSMIEFGDRDILQALTNGMAIVSRPYAKLGQELQRSEEEILRRLEVLSDAGIISRLGVIVRHRALGWRANAMIVWDLHHDEITDVGPKLATQTGVTLCYQRNPAETVWPYQLYSMIHARSREEAMASLKNALRLPELKHVPYQILFSTRCFKQTGALIALSRERAA
ncbi:Lrp/AsnC family transcriptional regulator [Pseudopelagicola sp. nBUS_20]|uniref:siroheme decarboxylase subunit beta n=1 Tax=Pseudopelagicola sp. nBUS_20 TaxID=3395317 RepID=UPI003EB8D68B